MFDALTWRVRTDPLKDSYGLKQVIGQRTEQLRTKEPQTLHLHTLLYLPPSHGFLFDHTNGLLIYCIPPSYFADCLN